MKALCSLLAMLIIACFNLNAQSVIHQQIIEEMSLRTEEGQNELARKFVEYSLANPKTKNATFDEDVSIITITPKLSEKMVLTYQIKDLMLKMLGEINMYCNAPFIRALGDNGFTLVFKVDMPEDMKKTESEFRFMPYTEELVKRNPTLSEWHRSEKPNPYWWCVLNPDMTFVGSRSIGILDNEYWYEKEWLNEGCISSNVADLIYSYQIYAGTRQTEFVKEKIEEARSRVYRVCKKDPIQYGWEYIKSLFG